MISDKQTDKQLKGLTMADTWNHKTVITPDDALYIDGELIIKGNIVQVETTQIINKLESNSLIINSDGGPNPSDLGWQQYSIPQLVLKYDAYNQDALGWGMMYYRADDVTDKTPIVNNDPGLDYIRFSTVGYPVNGAIQITKLQTMPPNDLNSQSNIAILEGNIFSGNSAAAYRLTDEVTFYITSNDQGGYKDIIPTGNTFQNAGDTVTFNLNLDPTGVTPGVYGANVSTTNRIDVDSKGRITGVVNNPIDITLEQISGGTFTGDAANAVYGLFSAGTGLTYNGNTMTPFGQIYITDTTVGAGAYGQANTTPVFNVNQQGQLTSAADILINIEAVQVSDFEPAVEALLGAVTLDDGTGWTAANLAYTPGVFTYTTPTRAEVRNTLSADGPITYNGASGVIGLADVISKDLTFEGLVDLSNATVPGFTVDGNLEILGNINAVNKTDLRVLDANIYMNVGNVVQDSFIIVDRQSASEANSFLRWNSTDKVWSHSDGLTEWLLVRDTDDILEGSSNLWFTEDRVNATVNSYLVAGDGIQFINVIQPGNPNALGIYAKLGKDMEFSSQSITIGANVVTTYQDFVMVGDYDYSLGNVILPAGAESIDGYIYTELASNEAFIHMNGFNIPITPTVDFGRVDTANGVVASGALEIYAGTQIVPNGNSNANIALIRGIKGGANTSVYFDSDPASDGNVIIIDADGLNQQEVRLSVSAANVSGFGNITYIPSSGLFEHRGVTTEDIRNQFQGVGLIGYDPAFGEITTAADNYARWRFITDDGPAQEQDITSQERLTFQGGTGISVTNAGNVITIVNTNTSADITAVIAGAGLTGGGSTGDVTLDVGQGTGVTVDADTISIGQDVATTADVEFGSITTTEITSGAVATAGTIEGQWTLTPGTTLQATYADLAEKYKADKKYEPGTVVVIGGDAEVTACHSFMSMRVAGVISSNPAFTMNEALSDGVLVALKGRVPVRVSGQIKKGDLLVTADELGCATSAQTDDVPPTAVVGIALKDSEMGWTEVKV